MARVDSWRVRFYSDIGTNNIKHDNSPPKVVMSTYDYNALKDLHLMGVVAGPLLQYIIGHPWNDIKGSLTKSQQYVYSFWQADVLIVHEGWVAFFYKGGGECFDELIEGLDHLNQKVLKNIIVNATTYIEEPDTWKLFSELSNKLDQEGKPQELYDNEKLIEKFSAYQLIYLGLRPSVIASFAQYVRENIQDFAVLT